MYRFAKTQKKAAIGQPFFVLDTKLILNHPFTSSIVILIPLMLRPGD